MGKTSIEWTQYSWNFLRGCSRVSEGCRNCYAETIAGRFSGEGFPYHGLATMNGGKARWTGEISFHEDILLAPLKRKKPTTYFVNSMSDLFYEKVTDEMLDKAFAVMALCPQHTFQILTKRPERMRAFLTPNEFQDVNFDLANVRAMREVWPLLSKMKNGLAHWHRLVDAEHFVQMDKDVYFMKKWPLPNCWLGVSVEDQKTADERIPLLLDTPAAVRWISAEPLLGPINFAYKTSAGWYRNPLENNEQLGNVNWIVVGGESGPNSRPCDISNIRSIVEQCKAASTPVFVKQLGAKPFNGVIGFGPLIKDRKGGDMSEWPEHLRLREMPEIKLGL